MLIHLLTNNFSIMQRYPKVTPTPKVTPEAPHSHHVVIAQRSHRCEYATVRMLRLCNSRSAVPPDSRSVATTQPSRRCECFEKQRSCGRNNSGGAAQVGGRDRLCLGFADKCIVCALVRGHFGSRPQNALHCIPPLSRFSSRPPLRKTAFGRTRTAHAPGPGPDALYIFEKNSSK